MTASGSPATLLADPQQPVRRGRGRSLEGRKRILEATLKRLTESGFRGLTVEGVAADARVAKTTIYRWWPEKESLVLDALRQLPELGDADTGSLVGDLVQLRADLVELVEKHNLGVVLPVLMAECRQPSPLTGEVTEYVETRSRPWLRAVRRAIDRGDLPPGTDVEQAVGMMNGALLHSIYFGTAILDEETYLDCVRVVVAGLFASSEAGVDARRLRGGKR